MDDVFRALADPTRRGLLDELFKQDGQTLSALEKLHFLNPVPIRLVHDRWVSKYAEPWAAGLSELKTRIEEDVMEKVFEIYIKTTPERLWEAITDPELRSQYSFGVRVDSDWTAGSHYEAVHPAAP